MSKLKTVLNYPLVSILRTAFSKHNHSCKESTFNYLELKI